MLQLRMLTIQVARFETFSLKEVKNADEPSWEMDIELNKALTKFDREVDVEARLDAIELLVYTTEDLRKTFKTDVD